MLAAQPIISEFLASNDITLNDGFGDDSDWIEIFNAGDQPIDLLGYHLTDDEAELDKWTFNSSTLLNPNEYLIVFASSEDTTDPQGYHHTNFKLSAGGEYLALTDTSSNVLSEVDGNTADYPQQFTDLSYGLSVPVLVDGQSRAEFLVPSDGSLGTAWTGIGFDAGANGFTEGKASLGYENNLIGGYHGLFSAEVPSGTTSVYVRSEFNLDSAASVTKLNLNLLYDDGIAVYLNGSLLFDELTPAPLEWNSVATDGRDDSVVLQGDNYSLDGYLSLLQDGENVLAIHVLNTGSGSSDLLIVPELTAEYTTDSWDYLLVPTPGAVNSSPIAIGPLIEEVHFSPSNPTESQDIVVTAEIAAFETPVDASSVRLFYRVMFGGEVELAMVDDGTGVDASAGDGIFTAQIPSSAFGQGEMVRWYVTAEDTEGVLTRAPRFNAPLDSPEYFGTVVIDPNVTTTLPVLYWFVEDEAAAQTRQGTRASVYYRGEFYDNVQNDLHGQSTAGSNFPKKAFDFDATNGNKFDLGPELGKASDFNLLTNYADKTDLRTTLAYETFVATGSVAHFAFSVVVHRNGSYYGLFDFVEEGDEEFLERVDLDPNGALYKINNGFNSATEEVEKKSREWEDRSDLQELVDTASLNTSQGKTWVYDNLQLSSWVNYLAIQSLLANRDYGQKNYYLYSDSVDSELWTIIPWDLDLSFGHQWNSTELYFDDDFITHDGYYVQMDGNHLLERLDAIPEFDEMYRRRLRSLMDEYLGTPGTPIEDSLYATRFDELLAEIGVDAIEDLNVWGTHPDFSFETPAQAIERLKSDYLAVRRSVLNNLFNMPDSQGGNLDIEFATIDYDPVSGNQGEEYIALVNQGDMSVDISGWSLSGSIDHTFSGGTVIPAGDTYYVVADFKAFQQRSTGPSGGQRLFVQGNYQGQLNDVGGSLLLSDNTSSEIAQADYGQPINGDFDGNDEVDGRDFLAWQRGFGKTSNVVKSDGDANADGSVDGEDLSVWESQYGQMLFVASVQAEETHLSAEVSEARVTDETMSVTAGPERNLLSSLSLTFGTPEAPVVADSRASVHADNVPEDIPVDIDSLNVVDSVFDTPSHPLNSELFDLERNEFEDDTLDLDTVDAALAELLAVDGECLG